MGVNFYSIEYKEEEIRPSNKQLVDRFKKYFKNYSNRLGTIVALEKQLEMIYDEKNRTINNLLFSYIITTFNASNCINIYSFFETSERVDGLKQFLSFLRANHKAIYTKRFFEKINKPGGDYEEVMLPEILDVIKEIEIALSWIIYDHKKVERELPGLAPILAVEFKKQSDEIKRLNSIVSKIKFFRDKYYAHKDIEIFVNNKKVEPKVTAEDIKFVISWLETTLNKLYLPFGRSTHIFCPMNATEGMEQFIHALHTMSEFRELIHNARVKKNPIDLINQMLAKQNKEIDLNAFLENNDSVRVLTSAVPLTEEYKSKMEETLNVELTWEDGEMKVREKK